jgi:hypothetical protein
VEGIMRNEETTKRKRTEQIAIEQVLQYERSRGRNPSVENKRGTGYDIVSGDRRIEVKGTSWTWEKNKSSFQYVSENERRKATHLYLVCDVYGKKELFIFEMARIHKALTPEVRYALHFSKCCDDESDESRLLHNSVKTPKVIGGRKTD